MKISTLVVPKKFQDKNLPAHIESSIESYQTTLAMLDGKINHYRKQYLMKWEKNHATQRAPFDEKIAELKTKKDALRKLYTEAKVTDKNLSVDCLMDIKLK
jgi:hypothetical protein